MYAVFLLITVLYLWGTFHVSATVLPVFLEKIPSDWKEEGWVPSDVSIYSFGIDDYKHPYERCTLFFHLTTS